MRQPREGFQLRLEEGVYHVYLIRVGECRIPAAEQVAVFSDRSRAKAQPVADALNSGLLHAVSFALGKSHATVAGG